MHTQFWVELRNWPQGRNSRVQFLLTQLLYPGVAIKGPIEVSLDDRTRDHPECTVLLFWASTAACSSSVARL